MEWVALGGNRREGTVKCDAHLAGSSWPCQLFLQEVTCALLSFGTQHELHDWDVQKCQFLWDVASAVRSFACLILCRGSVALGVRCMCDASKTDGALVFTLSTCT